MWFIVDGYNLLFRKVPEKGQLKHHREILLERLVQMSPGYEISVVFDAPFTDSHQVRTHVRDLEIIYTDEGVSADDTICDMIAFAKSPSNCTVVTSDNRLAWRARQLGAKTLAVEKFLSLPPRKKRKEKEPPTDTPRASHLRQESPEFLRWLDIFEDRLKDNDHE